jgi:hypothetical protein
MWWTRTQRIRTAAEVPFELTVAGTTGIPLYQRIAWKALHLKHLGLSQWDVARRLGVASKTVVRALG